MTSTTTAGFTLEPVFTAPGAHGFDGVEFTLRDALIQSGSGKTVFEQNDCEVPTSWSQSAINIAASKYFHGALGTPEREHSVKQLINRVVDTITAAAIAAGYFDGQESATAFQNDLKFSAGQSESGIQLASLVQCRLCDIGARKHRRQLALEQGDEDCRVRTLPGTTTPSAPRVSSTRCKTRCPRFLTSRRRRACCSSGDRAQARTSQFCVDPPRSFRAAARLLVLSAL